MPDWVEPVSKEKVNATRQLPAIPFTWEETTVPEVPVNLPTPAMLKVTPEGILVHAERKDDRSSDLSPESTDLQFLKQDIVCVNIWLMPPIEDGLDARYISTEDFSRAVIHHRDPFEVVESFASTFTADQHYWLRALAKALKGLGVKHTFEEIKSAR